MAAASTREVPEIEGVVIFEVLPFTGVAMVQLVALEDLLTSVTSAGVASSFFFLHAEVPNAAMSSARVKQIFWLHFKKYTSSPVLVVYRPKLQGN